LVGCGMVRRGVCWHRRAGEVGGGCGCSAGSLPGVVGVIRPARLTAWARCLLDLLS